RAQPADLVGLERLEPREVAHRRVVATLAVGLPAEAPDRLHALRAARPAAQQREVVLARAIGLPRILEQQRGEQVCRRRAGVPLARGDRLGAADPARHVAGARNGARLLDAIRAARRERVVGRDRLGLAAQAEERLRALASYAIRLGGRRRAGGERGVVGGE